MGKIILQFSVLVLLFLAVWAGIGQIDFVGHFNLRSISTRTERKIGDAIMKTLEHTHKKIHDDTTQQVLNTISERLSGKAAAGDIHMYLVQNSDINAFALPGNNIVVYAGLINCCDSVQELCGVIAHETGHIKLNHVIKRMAGEMGIAALATMTSNGKMASQAITVLSSSAFERKQESDADAYAVTCLKRANINPAGFANFMAKMAEMQKDIPEEMEWVSSHPWSTKRAEAIRTLSGNGPQTDEPVITTEEWAHLKKAALSK